MNVSRRGFLAGIGGALALGFDVGCGTSFLVKHADLTGEFSPNMWISVKHDGRVALAVNKAEIGQGITTMFATLAAEDLDVPVEAIDFYFADSFPQYATLFGMRVTGGSTSTKETFLPLRRAGAAAREMLVTAASQKWGVDAKDCVTDDGFVLHPPTKRKLGYGELTLDAARLPVPGDPKLKPKSEFKKIGKRDKRNDSYAKVAGGAHFGVDVVVPNMVRAYPIHGPRYGAQPASVKADKAKAHPGVVDVVTFDGGVAVVAEKYWQAMAAARDVEVTWTDGEVKGLDTEQMRLAMRTYSEDGEDVRDDGNAKKAIDKAALKVEAIYEAPYLAHACMEPQNCTVHVRDDKVEVWSPTQSPTIFQNAIAEVVGVSPSDVLVHTTFIGGGFGRRIVPDVAVQCAQVAKQVKRPVQMIWSRESDMTQASYRPQTACHLRGALTSDGKSVAGVSGHVINQSILLDSLFFVKAAFNGSPRGVQNVLASSLGGLVGSNTLPDPLAMEGLRNSVYTIENTHYGYSPVHAKLPVCSWRSVANSINAFFIEGLLDELAVLGKQDPIALRRTILPEGSQARRCLDAVAKLAGWVPGQQSPKPGWGRGVARHFCFDTEVAEIADVEIVDGKIKVRRVYAVVDCGIAVNPDIVRAQVEGAIIFGLSAALQQEITLVDGVVQQTNFDGFPPLRMVDAPEIVVEIMDSENEPTGIGEPGLPPAAPAVANAVFAATGVRLRRMPFQRCFEEARR